MKAIVNPSVLGKELKRTSGLMSKNSILPIVNCVKLYFDKNKLTITVTDLETTEISNIYCECQKSFCIIIDFASLYEVCNKLVIPFTIEEGKNSISIYSEEGRWKFPKGGEPADFPVIPEDNFIFSVDVESDFFYSLYNADSCKHSENERMTSACLEFKKDTLTIVGTDAFVMYKKDINIKSGQTGQYIPGSRFVQAIKGFQSGKLSIGEKFAKVEQNGTTVITRLRDSKFVEYHFVFPEKIIYNLTTNRNDLISSLSKASLTTSKVTHLCVLNFIENGIKVVSQDVDFEKSGELEIKATQSVEIDAIGVNSSQLLKILNILDSEEIQMSITTPTKSIYIKPADDDTTICLVQPLRFN